MFRSCNHLVLLHLSGTVIRTAADHPFFLAGQGWVNAAELPGPKSNRQQQLTDQLSLGEPTMPDQPRQTYPFLGFVAGTPLLTPEGITPIQELRPGDVIQPQRDDPGDPDAHDRERPGW